jgi:hypothetical protein
VHDGYCKLIATDMGCTAEMVPAALEVQNGYNKAHEWAVIAIGRAKCYFLSNHLAILYTGEV